MAEMISWPPARTVCFANGKRTSPQLRSTLVEIGHELLTLLQQPPSNRRDALFALDIQRASRLGFAPVFNDGSVTWKDAAA